MGRCPKPRIRHVAEGRGKNTPTPLPERIFPLAVKAKASDKFFLEKRPKKNPSALTGLKVTK